MKRKTTKSRYDQLQKTTSRARRGGGAQQRAALSENAVKSTKRRIEGTFYFLVVALFFFAGRMVQLQAMNRSDTHLSEDDMFVKRQVLPAPRGQILAADGTALAITANEYDVAINPRAVSDQSKMASLLAKTIGGSEAEYLDELAKVTRADGSKNFYVRLARHVDEARVDKLRALMRPPKDGKENRLQRTARKEFWAPVSLESTPRRQYPLGNFASQIIGFTTNDGAGADGMEQAWNKDLAGRDGEIVSQMDAQGRPIPGFVQKQSEPVAGRSLVTTLDPEIQAGAQATMEELVRKFRPNFATAIVMRPKTGEIVAMVTAPSFDLNKRPKNVVDLATNRATQFAYEPGSTFKIITAAATVERVPNWQNLQFTTDGSEKIGKHVIHDWMYWLGHREAVTRGISEGIRDSSNLCMWHFARIMGAPTMLDYAQKFGIGKSIEMGGLRSPAGWLAPKPGEWSAEQLANFSFGQGMLVTPLQIARVASTVANGGVMMKPMLIKEIRDEQGGVLQSFKPEEEGQVIRPETAKLVMGMLERVVQEGTARKYIFVPGYASAGKTGSAQKADGPRGYAAGKFISSFVGVIPAKKPEFVILVMADEPHGSHWGSEVCGPAYQAIAAAAMLRLRLQEGAAAPAPDAALMKRPKEKAIR